MHPQQQVASLMGYETYLSFPRARDAIRAWCDVTGKKISIPSNCCPILKEFAYDIIPIDLGTGQAPSTPVQLYGYRHDLVSAEIELDPLMTGLFFEPRAEVCIVSFGHEKTIGLGNGGLLLCNREWLLEYGEKIKGEYWPPILTEALAIYLQALHGDILMRRQRILWWERYLGGCLSRIHGEQVIPWRLMKRATTNEMRNRVVKAMRDEGFDVGTNYPSLVAGTNGVEWGDTVLNLWLTPAYDQQNIEKASEVIKRAI